MAEPFLTPPILPPPPWPTTLPLPTGRLGPPPAGSTYVPPPDTVMRAAQSGFQAGVEAGAPGQTFHRVGPFGISPQQMVPSVAYPSTQDTMAGVSPAGPKAATALPPNEPWGGACVQWKEWHGIALPQPGSSLKDCGFDWMIGGIAALAVAFGLLFFLGGVRR